MLIVCRRQRVCASVHAGGRLHELLLGAFRANDVFGVGDEASADQRCLARGADEAIVVPVTVLERDESGAADSCEPGGKNEKDTRINIILFRE